MILLGAALLISPYLLLLVVLAGVGYALLEGPSVMVQVRATHGGKFIPCRSYHTTSGGIRPELPRLEGRAGLEQSQPFSPPFHLWSHATFAGGRGVA